METVLITGAGGEVGHGLIEYFSSQTECRVIAIDLNPPQFRRGLPFSVSFLKGDILDGEFLAGIEQEYDFSSIYHLAGILSTGAERNPVRAHDVNVTGSLNILSLARRQSERRGSATKVIFPSTIAVYGLSSTEIKVQAGKVTEDEYLNPVTIYGMNKLYVEHLGRYFASYVNRFAANISRIDFRAVRFPGLLSAQTVPTGGTSDYAPEMLHAAARGEPYICFVGEDARLPFMAMPDAIRALIDLAQAPREALRRTVYNVTSFSPSAGDFLAVVKRSFPNSSITFGIDHRRADIVDSWPADIDDSAARSDWGWNPQYDFATAFARYLIPGVVQRYAQTKTPFGLQQEHFE